MTAFPSRPAAVRHLAYTGCFTTEKRRAKGDGIHVFRVDPATARWSHAQHVDGLVNPSWLFTNRAQTVLYSLHGDEDYATAFAIDPASGELALLNRARTGGVNGVSGKLDRSGRFMVVANYGNGTVAVLPVAADGSLGDAVQVETLPGEPDARHRVRQQERSHPHDIMFDPSGRCVAVPDKGLDRIFLFRFDGRAGRLTPCRIPHTGARSGAGPRHILFHPTQPVAWVLNELDSTVTSCAWNAARGTLSPVDVASTLPGHFVAENIASEIAFAPASSTLYVSNRGHDSIAVFRASRTDGRLRPLGWQPTGGTKPRFFTLDPAGRVLYAANETGHTITRFRVDGRSGTLSPFGRAIAVKSPAAIAFATVGGRG